MTQAWPLEYAGKGHTMKGFFNKAKVFLKCEDGPTATEYAVLLAVIAMTVLGSMASFGERVDSIYTAIDGATSGI